MVAWPGCLLWVLPLTCVTQFFMLTTFGPDTGASPVPWPPLLMYYAVFFGFGMLCFGRQAFESTACRLWPLSLLLAIPVFILGVYGYDQRTELFDPSQNASLSSFLEYHLLCTVFSSFYPWLMIFGLIGVFRKYCAAENRRVRYLSDASYWLYIAHLPLVMLLQIWIANATWPSGLKLLSICVLTTALLLGMYEYGVRYTWIGTMLNGRKFRDK
jgi:peptidoglycan/LPS O-acetylase OafA/YrhL